MNIEAYFKLTYGLYIVSSAANGKLNGYISNTVFQVTAEPPQIALACSKNNLTTSLIEQSRVFAVSVLERDTNAEVIGTFGYKSGNETDKFTNLNFKTGKTGTPILLNNAIAIFRTPDPHQIKLAVILKIIFKSVPGKVVSVWLRIKASSLAAILNLLADNEWRVTVKVLFS